MRESSQIILQLLLYFMVGFSTDIMGYNVEELILFNKTSWLSAAHPWLQWWYGSPPKTHT
jgi:hypothetical protein